MGFRARNAGSEPPSYLGPLSETRLRFDPSLQTAAAIAGARLASLGTRAPAPSAAPVQGTGAERKAAAASERPVVVPLVRRHVEVYSGRAS